MPGSACRVLAVVVLVAAIIGAGLATKLRRGRRPVRVATAVAGMGVAAVLALVGWTIFTMAARDPVTDLEGFEEARTLPSIGVGVALLGALTMVVAGLLARTDAAGDERY